MESFDDNLQYGAFGNWEQIDELASERQPSALPQGSTPQGSPSQDFSLQNFAQISNQVEGYNQSFLEYSGTVSHSELTSNFEESYHAASPGQSTLPTLSQLHNPLTSSQGQGGQKRSPGAEQFRRRIGHQKWDDNKDLIRTLYLDKDYSLVETKKVLEDEYNFSAS